MGLEEPPALLEALATRYRESHRAYHDLRHIEECFEALEQAARANIARELKKS